VRWVRYAVGSMVVALATSVMYLSLPPTYSGAGLAAFLTRPSPAGAQAPQKLAPIAQEATALLPSPTPTPPLAPQGAPTWTPPQNIAPPTSCKWDYAQVRPVPNLQNPSNIIITWVASGGCTPFSGTITATFSDGVFWHTYATSWPSGALGDSPHHPLPCPTNPLTITYVMQMTGGRGQTTSAQGSIGVLPLCP
jgi:hypothetical protein